MFNKSANQTKLDELQQPLIEWETSVPVAAKKFHDTRKKLLSKIEKKRGALRWMLRENEIKVFQDDFENLVPLATELPSLFSKKQRLVKQINKLPEQKWLLSLSPLGENCACEPELNSDQAELIEIEIQVNLSKDAVPLLNAAKKILETLGQSADTAALEVLLSEENISTDLLEKLKSEVQSLKPKADAAKKTATKTSTILSSVFTQLNKLKSWSRELDDFLKDKIDHLNERYILLNGENRERDFTQVNELENEATQLYLQIVAEAKSRRNNKIIGLRELFREFNAWGFPHDLQESELIKLEQRPVDRHSSQQKWMDDFNKLEERFNASVDLFLPQLKGNLDNNIANLNQLLTKLKTTSLSQKNRETIAKLEIHLAKFANLQELTDILFALKKVKQFKIEIDALEKQAEAERQALSKRQELLITRNQENQQLAGEVSYQLANLQEALNNIGPNNGENLENAQERLVELETKLDLQDDNLALINKMVQSQKHLQTVDFNALSETDRAEVMEFLEGFDDIDVDDVEDMEFLAELLVNIDNFLLRFGEEEEKTKAQKKRLLKSLKRFRNNGLNKYIQIKPRDSFDVISKVEALLLAEPSHQQQWINLNQQLDFAEKLFERLENQATRLAAQELDRLIKIVDHHRHASNDSQFVTKAQDILDKVQQYSKEQLPPLTLRSELDRLARY